MDFDWLTIQLDKVNTLPEWASLLLFLSGFGVALWYISNKQKSDANTVLDEKTISSYKNALESTRADLQAQLDHCTDQHTNAQNQLDSQGKKMADLEGQLKTLREIPLAEMAKGIQSIMITNGKILDTLRKSAIVLENEKEKR